MVEKQITRQAVITVHNKHDNTYGDLLFNDENGTEYKISNKRVQYFDVVQDGAVLQLNFAVAYNREYIYNAVPVKEALIKPPVAPPTAELDPEVKAEFIKAREEVLKPSGQEVGMTTKEIGDMIRAEKLSTIFGAETAKQLVEWYKNRIKHTTGLN